MQASNGVRRLLIGVVVAGSLWGAASAQPEQDTDMYDGKWTAKVQGAEVGYQSARVTVANYAGTWQDTSPRNAAVRKECRGKTFPITVQRSVSTAFEFTVFGSAVSPACPDLSVSVKSDGPKALVGNIDGGATVRLVKR